MPIYLKIGSIAGTTPRWCPGIPGAGKSVMTSIAIRHIEQHTERTNVAIAYVYCDYKDSKVQSKVELISSIARQLAEQVHPIPQDVKIYRDRWTEKRSYPTHEERISLIENLVLHFNKAFVFVDALVDIALCGQFLADRFECTGQNSRMESK